MDTLRQWAARTNAPDLTEAERSLVERRDALCDLAVGAFGRDAVSVATVYRRAQTPALRLAVLANSYYVATGWAGTILDEDEARALLSTGTGDELETFFANPRLSPDGLLDVLMRRGPASVLGVEHDGWSRIFTGLATNDALGDLFDTRQVLPSASARYQMNGALRHCLRSVYPTLGMGPAVGDFLVALLDERAPGAYFPADDLPQLVLAWHPSVATDASSHPFFKVQMLLSILYGYPEEDARGHAFASVRAAAMAQAPLDSEQDMEGLFTADRSAFFTGLPYHRALYEDPALSSRFVSMAAVHNDTALTLYLQRQAKLDAYWGLDRPASVRDIQNLRSLVLKRQQPSQPSMSEADMESLRQAMTPPTIDPGRSQDSKPTSPWKIWGLASLVALAILLIFRLLQANAVEHIRNGLQ